MIVNPTKQKGPAGARNTRRPEGTSKLLETILFSSSAPVKATRRFAAGLLPSRPVYIADHTAADEAWLVEDNARRETEVRNRLIDRRYSEAYATDCVSLGLIPNDAAESLGATSVVGHRA